jgi:hypothetical protein
MYKINKNKLYNMRLNLDFFGKEMFKKYLYNHQPYQIIIVLFGIILTYKTISPFYSTFLIFGLGYYYYFIHILLHMIPEKYNFHLLLHHNVKQSDKNILHYTKAIIFDICCCFVLYYFQILINYELFPPILILYHSIIYTTVNNINYSILHLGNYLQHLDKTTNFGPDSIDHLLGTNNNATFEHMYHYILNTIFAFLVTVVIFCDKNDVL